MKTNRWSTAVAGVFLQMALGAVYAWSVFRAPLRKQFGWSIRFSRGRDGGFGRASLVHLSSPPDEGSVQIYSTSTNVGCVNLTAAGLAGGSFERSAAH